MVSSHLIKLTEEAGLDDVTWAILGGNPSSYEYLSFNLYRSEGQDKGKILGQLLCDEVFTAIELVRESRLNDGRMERILQFFDRKVGMIPCQVVDSQKIRRPTPDKVFRKVEKYGKSILIVASNAINIILRYNLTKKPTMELANDLALKCVE